MFHQPFIIPSAIFFILSLPLILRFVPRNRIYGIRTSKTISDELVWYRANRYGGWMVLLSSLFYFLVALLFPTSDSHDSDFLLWLLHLFAFTAPLLLSLYLTAKYIKRL